MRLILGFALVAFAAAAGSCQSNCTQHILDTCTPKFQWKSEFDDQCACFLLDLAKGELYKDEVHSTCGASIDDYNFTTGTLWATIGTGADAWTPVENVLVYTTVEAECSAPARSGASETAEATTPPGRRRREAGERREAGQRREAEPLTLNVQFLYSDTKKDPVFCEDGEDQCVVKLKLYTDYVDCETAPGVSGAAADNDVATSWSGSNSGSSRRRRRSRRSTNGDERRAGGCVNPLFSADGNGLLPTNEICQLGQCCGPAFCHRDQNRKDCMDAGTGDDTVWTPGAQCEDSSCVPNYGGTGAGKGGVDVDITTSLENAQGALGTGGKLFIETIALDDASNGLPVVEGPDGEYLVAFSINRETAEGVAIDDYLNETGSFILVKLSSPALTGFPIIVWRVDTDGSLVNSIDDCAHIDTDGTIFINTTTTPPTYQVPICHTSNFTVTANNTNTTDDCEEDGDDDDGKGKGHDGKDHKGNCTKSKTKKPSKKGKKGTKSGAKPDKKAKTSKSGLKDAKKEVKKAKGKKAAIAIGVGVTGGAIVLAGLGVALKRRRSGKKSSSASDRKAVPVPNANPSVVTI